MTKRKNIYITFDADWAHEEVLADAIEIIENSHARATIFATNKCSIFNGLDFNQWEIGIHPSYSFENYNDSETVDKMKSLFPDSKSIRCHSLVQSTRLLEKFASMGFTHESNLLLPHWSGMSLKPFLDCNGIVRCPYCWADDATIVASQKGIYPKENIDKALHSEGLLIFAFHPIHIFLNTEDLARYEMARSYLKEPNQLRKIRCASGLSGARDYLLRTLCVAKNNGYEFGLIKEIKVV